MHLPSSSALLFLSDASLLFMPACPSSCIFPPAMLCIFLLPLLSSSSLMHPSLL